MTDVIPFNSSYQLDLNNFLKIVMSEMGYEFDLDKKDLDIKSARDSYLASGGCFLLAIDSGSICGSVGARNIGNGIAELKRFYVRSTYQGKRIGSRLLNCALEFSKTSGFNAIRLDTTQKSFRAVKMFEKQGFSIIPRYNTDPFAEIFMELCFS